MRTVIAYLDPGSGSMVLQAILGGVAGAAVALKMFGRRILTALRLRKPSTPKHESADSEGGPA